MLLRRRGHEWAHLASRLGRLSKLRNGCAHYDVGLAAAVVHFCNDDGGAGPAGPESQAAADSSPSEAKGSALGSEPETEDITSSNNDLEGN